MERRNPNNNNKNQLNKQNFHQQASQNKKNNNNIGTVLFGLGAAAVGVVAGFVVSKLFDSKEKQKEKQYKKQLKQQQEKIKQQELQIEHQRQQEELYSGEPPIPDNNNNENLYCPISMSLMTDPYFIRECGHSFQKQDIEQWLQKNKECPVCKTKCDISDLRPNYTLKNYISDIQQQQPQ